MSRVIGRMLLAIVAVAVTLLLCEGVLSLGFRKSLRPRPAFDLERMFQPGAENAAPINGIFASNVDPAVAHTLRLNAELTDRSAKFHTDAIGLRARPPIPANALKIVVLGDSVAFGAGLADDETIGSQLEATLNAVRGPSAQPVAVSTVGVPGWNHRNAVQFFVDHFEEFDPAVVVYLPVSNDLYDSLSIAESGLQQIASDPMADDPLLTVNHESIFAYQYFLGGRVARGEVKDAVTSLDDVGANGVMSDLGPESKARYDDNADSIARLESDLVARGRKLALLFYTENPGDPTYAWTLRERLLARGIVAPDLPGIAHMTKELGLPGDPHPNPTCARGLAILIAEGLLSHGLVDRGEGIPLPELPALVRDARAEPRDVTTIHAEAARCKAEAMRILQPTIDLGTGRGFQQVIGGMNPDGTARCRFLALLRGAGKRLRFTLGALPGKTLIYPLSVEAFANQASLGTITIIAGDAPTEATFTVPDSVRTDVPFEVKLVPARWTMTSFERRPIVASFRVLRIESTE